MYVGVLLGVNGSHLAGLLRSGGRGAPLPHNFSIALCHLCSISVELPPPSSRYWKLLPTCISEFEGAERRKTVSIGGDWGDL